MPFIVLKRADIPEGVLQVTDLQPNTSLRNPITDPPEQSRYCRPILNERPVVDTSGGVTRVRHTVSGLAAWFLVNVSDGGELSATGTITTVVAADLLDNETFTITDPPNGPLVFAFNVTGLTPDGGYIPVPGEVEVDVSAAVTADDVRDAIISAINGETHPATFRIVAEDGGAGVVDITNEAPGTDGNVLITDTVADAGFTTTGMAGGTDANALTVTEAVDNATAVIDLLQFNVGVTLAVINSDLAVGEIDEEDLEEIHHILAGEIYTVPAGVQIESGSVFSVSPAPNTTGGPAFVAGTNREVFNTPSLRASCDVGVLSKLLSSTFTYKGVTGPAVIVYNDDGTLFTP